MRCGARAVRSLGLLLFHYFVIGYQPAMRRLTFSLWFLIGFRVAVTYLLFQSNPRLGSQVLLSISICFALLVLLGRMADMVPEKRITLPRPIALYLGWAALSLLWTESPFINAAGYFLILLCDLWLVSVFVHPAKAMQGYIAANLCVVVLAVFAPGADDGPMGHQDFLHPNAIGNQFAIACFFCFALWRASHKKRWMLAGAMLMLALLFVLSKTAILSFAAAAFYYLFIRSGFKWREKLKLAAVLGVLVSISFGTLYAYAMYYFETDDYLTLTGRTVIWATSAEIAMQRPWFGHGYYSYRALIPWFGAENFPYSQAHNELLQQWFTLGIPGVALAVWIYVWFARRAWKRGLGAAILIYALLHGLTEAHATDLTVPLSVLLLVSSLRDKFPSP